MTIFADMKIRQLHGYTVGQLIRSPLIGEHDFMIRQLTAFFNLKGADFKTGQTEHAKRYLQSTEKKKCRLRFFYNGFTWGC